MQHTFNKGSEWRKWDLHIHTPYSICQKYGGESSFDQFIDALEKLPKEVKVIGITDYYFIDGYEKVMEFRNKGRLSNIDKIFPILEFRIDTFGSSSENKLNKFNLHILFDIDENNLLEEIQKIKTEFIRLIPISSLDKHKTKMLSKENLTSEGGNNLQKGFECVVPPTKKVFELINDVTWKDKVFIFSGYKEWSNLDKNNQLKPYKEDFYSKVHAFLSASPRESFQQCQDWLNLHGDKRLLHSQDIHSFEILDTANKNEAGEYINSTNYYCDTWIKADPTFDGLKQIISEPKGRVFIGDSPPIFENVTQNRTKYIKSIKVKPIDGYKGQLGKWFDFDINFNNELVAIIGNKGSGKSAVADMIALCSNIDSQSDFSFLDKRKFRSGKLAKNFEAELTFHDGSVFKKNLDDVSLSSTTKFVKYLPQGYFEKLCNEISKVEEFKMEIESIVFQYIDESDKLGADNFEELISSKTISIDTSIVQIKQEIESQCKKLVSLEKKANIKYKTGTKDSIQQKEKELEALVPPVVVLNPNDDVEVVKENEPILQAIEQLKAEISGYTQDIQCKKNEKGELNIEIQKIKQIKSIVEQLSSHVQNIKSENDIAIFGLQWDEIIEFKADVQKLERLIADKEARIKTINFEMGLEKSDVDGFVSIADKLTQKQQALFAEQTRLTAKQQEYQLYLDNLTKYNSLKCEIEGELTNPISGTLNWLKKELKYLEEDLNADINELFDVILIKTGSVYEKKKEVVDIYKAVKNKIDNIIHENRELLSGFEINIEASLDLSSLFEGNLLNLINKKARGSFYGTQESSLFLKKLLESKDIDNHEEVEDVIRDIWTSLKFDKREGQNNELRYIDDQTLDLELFYSYLFSLDYLDYNYQLKQNGKQLEYLSPGEKGALLLVFYLLLDMDNRPLILDQPEDNLDNASVANILVKFIKKAKNRRQIIMVTHNPNLAVVADAEQVIYVNIDKQDNNAFSFESGSIECPKINARIVDVLEGAMPAFRKRDDKYYDVK